MAKEDQQDLPGGQQSRLMRFIEARLPVCSFFRRHICRFRVPNNLNYFYTFGGILTLVLVAQILTGLVVAIHYVPDTAQAFASRQVLMRDVPFGWLFLPWHAVGASFFFIAAYIHLARGLYYGSHRAPRELVWLIGMAIYCTMMATAFFGYVLSWGLMSSSAAAVIIGLFKAVPFIGPWLGETLLGGYSIGQPLLSRFYVLHFLLPFILLALVGLHIVAVHYVGQNNPTGRALPPQETLPFIPYALAKDCLAICVFLLFFCWFLFYMPDYFGQPDNFTPADTLKTAPHILPEWYFLPFYAMLKAINFDLGFISSTLGGAFVMFAAIAVLFFVPWLDRSPVYSARSRPLYRVFYWLFVADMVALGWLGACPAEPLYIALAQAATAAYFAFFLLIMPFLPRLEKRLYGQKGGQAGKAGAPHMGAG
ncbi:cytochrome b [Candidatus Tokpelaia sp.]|uniref:cytochrome b n=1 Tax=Candidatus Tokpelaia sp. TaxID=2233777 RepID=UPI00123A8D9A|nr:cytochrome b N-terminal domain-containing protein [Candidatus Tokpelaia sp.]KAA6405902.1 cytochrome bc complex cytochrome b subunit [Candidatus Tokpelaia sp.]